MYSFLSTDPVTTDPEYSQLLRMGNKCEERLPSDVNRITAGKQKKATDCGGRLPLFRVAFQLLHGNRHAQALRERVAVVAASRAHRVHRNRVRASWRTRMVDRLG